MLALLPVKTFSSAKQRLSSILSPMERAALSKAMLTDVLSTLTSHNGIEGVVMCTHDPVAQTLANNFGVRVFLEPDLVCQGLNQAVHTAVQELKREAPYDLMVVHSDLPLLNHDELTRVIETQHGITAPGITLVPDQRRDGTNLLAWNLMSDFPCHYGANSFSKHCEQAERLNMATNICVLPGASLDIDESEDLRQLASAHGLAGAPATREFLYNHNRLNPHFAGWHHHAVNSNAHDGDQLHSGCKVSGYGNGFNGE